MDEPGNNLYRKRARTGIQSPDIGALSDRELNTLVSDLLAKKITSKKELEK